MIFLILCSLMTPSDWPQWGGPNRNFIVQSPKLADSWGNKGPRELWRKPLGGGYSGIVTHKNVLYTIHRKGDLEVIEAMDTRTGESLWTREYEIVVYWENNPDYGTGPHATPLIYDHILFTTGYSGIMHAFDLADGGKLLWRKNLIVDYGGKKQPFGFAICPIVDQGTLIVPLGGSGGLVGLAPRSGKIIWQNKKIDMSYGSPKIIHVDGQKQLILYGPEEVMGINMEDHKKLWSFFVSNHYEYHIADTLFSDQNVLWVASHLESGGRGLHLSLDKGKTVVKKVWEDNKIKVHYWNPVMLGDTVYTAIGGDAFSVLAGVNINTGEVLFRKRGMEGAKLIHADEKLIFLDNRGTLGIAKINQDKTVTVTGSAKVLKRRTLTPPSLAGTILFARAQKEVVALELAPLN